MRFEFYHEGLRDVPKISVDGTVENAVHLSHWEGNRTPLAVKADTSTEIALNTVRAPNRGELTKGIELVTNNHFDTDGVLSVWTMLTGEPALAIGDKLVAAAESGDFSEYTTENAIRASIVIQGSDQPLPNESILSPLANHLAGESVRDEARAYHLVLPEVERVITRTQDYEPLWLAAWERIERALESFARGASTVEEHKEARLSVITLAPAVFGSVGFDPAEHSAPLTAISRHARGHIYLIALPMSDGWAYRMDYPYYSWAETVTRPRIARRNLAPLVAALNEKEESLAGRWKLDRSELSSAAKFTNESGQLAASSLAPDVVAEVISAHLLETEGSLAGAAQSG